MSEEIELDDERAAKYWWTKSGEQEKEIAALRSQSDALAVALETLSLDVEQYEAWQRPCYALDKARAALAQYRGKA